MVQRRKQIEVEAKEIDRKDRELEATVRKPTEAEAYKVKTLAEGRRLDCDCFVSVVCILVHILQLKKV